MDEDRWNRIAVLLNEIELTYMVNIGFPNGGDIFHDVRDDKIEVALATFSGYFGNASLSYEEQTIDRIIRYIKPYDECVKSRYGFAVDDALKFIRHIRFLNNRTLNEMLSPDTDCFSFYASHPEEWRKLTTEFERRGIYDPSEWIYQPELRGLMNAMKKNPGEILVHESKDVMEVDIDNECLQNIIKFFLFDKDLMKGKSPYYADKHYSESYPLIQCGDKFYTLDKFMYESLYYRLDEELMKNNPTGKYKQRKDSAFEKKVFDVFRQFFPPKTKILTNYSVDGVSENDLIVIFENTCIIVEIKNCKFREPFRDPIKAYGRISKDYSNAIQLGYEQCKRVEDILLSDQDVDILDATDKNRVLYHLRSKNIGDVWSIVVTDFKYGVIQTDLSKLLKKEDSDLYPWSVCIDDLESFLLLMKKLLKGIAPARFVEFLDYRERLQENVMCYDELEICGWYLNDRKQFIECVNNEDTLINTSSDMAAIFDAYYQVGLGFKDELDAEYKKNYVLPDYPKSFQLSVMNRDTLINEFDNTK
jgi:hypothetical protein